MIDEKIRMGIAKLPYSGSRVGEMSEGPDALEKGGLGNYLEDRGCLLVEAKTALLTTEEQKEYGAWHQLGLASHHLAEIVAEQQIQGLFGIGLLSNCNGLLGMLAGLQHSRSTPRPLRVSLVWIDAHADFNTPETTLSGMLGGMPVAVSTGQCLHRLRTKCGLDPALPTRYVTMVAVRDPDPLEQELLDRSEIQHITAEETRRLSPAIDTQMKRLSSLSDVIYVHVDMDVLDTEEVPGHGLTVRGGPTSIELGKALEVMLRYPKAAAFGIASYPASRDPDKRSLRAAYNLIEGVTRGLKSR